MYRKFEFAFNWTYVTDTLDEDQVCVCDFLLYVLETGYLLYVERLKPEGEVRDIYKKMSSVQ
jgi:hypothetical protein